MQSNCPSHLFQHEQAPSHINMAIFNVLVEHIHSREICYNFQVTKGRFRYDFINRMPWFHSKET
jgi:hypothetical protein